MFSVMFEVAPAADQWDAYLAYAKRLRPELETIDGFVDNIRYRSLTREGWLLSLSGWRDEKALVRWRAKASHHEVQQKGRGGVLHDYHLRVGQITADTQIPAGHVIREQRLDETEVGDGKTIVLLDGKRPPDWVAGRDAQAVASALGLRTDAEGLLGWDSFDAVLSPGDVIALSTWQDDAAVRRFLSQGIPDEVRCRTVRVIRDYGMFDRREAPQYYPQVERRQGGMVRGTSERPM
ncbi:antibiotic biosynthesis monooxygenase [Ramlibacter sp.]|uniref:antibiotic biosynthesis monooxygenase family protein n=1 Tax=Ramlibacter sp. TaxID=1917967 RepID=UPI0026290E0E|nr:antibiotic biosynthesis monooxygenase [Ramlibacter sp.]MDB5958043.1 Antibiotic biosynthesis monooxygenase [Ramlibacter sp.]